MGLTFEHLNLSGLQLGARSFLDNGVLTVEARELEARLRESDPRIHGVEIAVVHPGDSARLACVKDVIAPRCKLDGDSPGSGRIRSLGQVAVATCGPIVGYQEGIIDMSGPGAQYSPFSQLHLLVLCLEPSPGLDAHAHEEAVRLAGLRAAKWLAELTITGQPDTIETIAWKPCGSASTLPSVAYLYMVLSQGLLHDTHVCGRNARSGLPRVLDPHLLLDNGIVSGNCVSACDKNTTYHHQNNPVLRELLAGHGERWNFMGVVVTNEPTRLAEKERSAREAIQLIRELGAAGVVITKEGFGNPDADLMMLIRGLEQAGVQTVAITDEYAGPEGHCQSLADTTPEADAIVSTGNANARTHLPAMDRTLGMPNQLTSLAGAYATSVREGGALEVELQVLIGATNQLGFNTLTCQDA